MHTRKIGSLEVSAVGLGCMNFSMGYGAGDDEVSARLLHEALEVDYTFFDTATMYGSGHNESLIGETLKDRRQGFVLASKCGLSKDEKGNPCIDGRPETIRQHCEASLKRLQTDVIDLYYLHRLDKGVPVEESAGALGDLVTEGKIREIGFSEISSATLHRAHAEYPVAAVQSEYSLWSRTPEIKMLQTCAELGVAFVPFSPLARQFLTGKAQDVSQLTDNDLRCGIARPRFEPEAFAQNAQLLEAYGDIATKVGCSMAQLALAWLLAQQNSDGQATLIPIPGTKHIDFMRENARAGDIVLDATTVAELDSLINEDTVVGTRYTTELMAASDAERDRES
uniref:Aldo-keto reductase n=1 Tax=uncultured Thiotrichaceae bacterium TaxID=298394 RepID=A0A6S6TB77_9GAMM|nr:MAG: Aldo-keto reductase [uncultured Thiotrichaceae bacterium]